MTMLGFGNFGRIRQRIQRLLAAVGCALLLGFQAFSAWTVIHEADHDCSGEGCPVCVQLQQCVDNFQLTGDGLESEPLRFETPTANGHSFPAAVAEPQHITLVSLKVRMDE